VISGYFFLLCASLALFKIERGAERGEGVKEKVRCKDEAKKR